MSCESLVRQLRDKRLQIRGKLSLCSVLSVIALPVSTCSSSSCFTFYFINHLKGHGFVLETVILQSFLHSFSILLLINFGGGLAGFLILLCRVPALLFVPGKYWSVPWDTILLRLNFAWMLLRPHCLTGSALIAWISPVFGFSLSSRG